MSDNTIEALRAALFEQIRAVRAAEGDAAKAAIEKARAIGDLAGRVVETAKVEIDYARATQQATNGEFFGAEQPARIGAAGEPGPAETTYTPTGTKTTQVMGNGVAVTTHKLR